MMPISDITGNYKDKNILIVGGAGYIGFSLLKELSLVSCKITVLDVKDGILKPISGQLADISLRKVDIRNKEIWQEILRDNIDFIFYLAAQTSVYIANEDPLRDLEINLRPVVNFIEICQKNSLRPNIIFSGTVTEAGLTDRLPVNETFKDHPITVYDINKLAAEKYLQYYSNQMAGKAVILRLANVYGPGPKSSNVDRGILNLMIRKAIKGEPLTIYGEGNFIRDYIYIDDVVKAFLMAGANINVVAGKYYVIGSGKGYSVKEMINTVKDEVSFRLKKEVEVRSVLLPDSLSPIEFRNFIADSSAFRNKSGWKAEVSLKEGISRTLDYFLKEERIF